MTFMKKIKYYNDNNSNLTNHILYTFLINDHKKNIYKRRTNII